MDGWMGVKAVLRIAYSNQKSIFVPKVYYVRFFYLKVWESSSSSSLPDDDVMCSNFFFGGIEFVWPFTGLGTATLAAAAATTPPPRPESKAHNVG
jgi:hypothetical protein